MEGADMTALALFCHSGPPYLSAPDAVLAALVLNEVDLPILRLFKKEDFDELDTNADTNADGWEDGWTAEVLAKLQSAPHHPSDRSTPELTPNPSPSPSPANPSQQSRSDASLAQSLVVHRHSILLDQQSPSTETLAPCTSPSRSEKEYSLLSREELEMTCSSLHKLCAEAQTANELSDELLAPLLVKEREANMMRVECRQSALDACAAGFPIPVRGQLIP